ncbi:MAG: hypothetical protein WBN13_11470, partial [Robiginitalea sp.]|uniref:hypothetical protein n=1 Tax=Robiginitalea sp. TaxID=1902411 RepID=UPI003C7207A8
PFRHNQGSYAVYQYVNELISFLTLKKTSQFPRKAGANIMGFFNKTIKKHPYFFLFFRTCS